MSSKGTKFFAWQQVAALFCAGVVLAANAAGQATGTGRRRAAKPSRAADGPSDMRPKLVVLLVVDQLRADYVDKFRKQWKGGLKRLIDQGAWFREAAYPYANTFTCAGHATISTGAYPATHGIMGNAWHDRETNKQVTCTADPSVEGVGYGPAPKTGESAFWLEVPTLADEMRFQNGGKTRVATFSLKARAAIMLAGHRGNAVTWHDTSTGAWVSSTAYETNPLVAAFVKAHPIENDYGKTWSPTLSASEYLYEVSAEGKAGPRGWGPNFPHPLRGAPESTKPDADFYTQWETSPNADAYLAEMAASVADGMKFGKGPGTDFLGISFSTLDLAGHAYGPRSHEVQDVLLRLDRTLGQFFEHLDKSVGRSNYVVALSADHGVAPIPLEMRKAGLDAGWIGAVDVLEKINKTLEKFPSAASSDAGRNAVSPEAAAPKAVRMIDGDVWLANGLYARLRQDRAALRAVIEAVQNMPGVARVFSGEELKGKLRSGDFLVRAAATNYVPGRSGDLIVMPKPYWLFGSNSTTKAQPYGTTHGSPYDYDQRVPVFLMGFGIKRGEYLRGSTPADIAPTLAFLCGITLARPDGRLLREALVQTKGAGARE